MKSTMLSIAFLLAILLADNFVQSNQADLSKECSHSLRLDKSGDYYCPEISNQKV